MKRWLSRRKLNRSMQEYEKMTKVYCEWRTNQEMERRVLFDKQDADVAGQAVRKILEREQEQDLMVLENIIQHRKTQGLATGSLDADMLAELEQLKQVLRDRTESCRVTDRKWRLEHFLKSPQMGYPLHSGDPNILWLGSSRRRSIDLGPRPLPAAQGGRAPAA